MTPTYLTTDALAERCDGSAFDTLVSGVVNGGVRAANDPDAQAPKGLRVGA